MTSVLQTPLQYLKGVGPRRAADLARVGLMTVEDLLHRFPIRYEDRSRLQPIASLKPGRRVERTPQLETRPMIAAVWPGRNDATGCRRLRSS